MMPSYQNYQQYEKKFSDKPGSEDRTYANKDYQTRKFVDVKKDWRKYCEYWKNYPDRFLDFVKPPDSNINLYFYQRILLRLFFRYQKVFVTATRGFSKSYLAILSFYLKCIMHPGIKIFLVAPTKGQAASITQERLEDDIWVHFPLLRNEVKEYKKGIDYTKLLFYNNSKLDVVQIKDSTRGGRKNLRHLSAMAS